MPLFRGKQIDFTLPTLPSWSNVWEGKLVYISSNQTIYYGGNSGWIIVQKGPVSLDDAYDNGNIINTDNGPVDLNVNGSNYAPLRLNELTSAPSIGLTGGEISIFNNRLYTFDSSRGKWLSVQRDKPIFSKRRANGTYLPLVGTTTAKDTGFICHYNSTIIGVTATCHSSGYQNKTVRIRRNGLEIDLFTFTMSAGWYSKLDLNINLNQYDILQVFVDPGNNQIAKYLTVQLEIAYSN